MSSRNVKDKHNQRFSQMSAQAALISKKKAEIEDRLKKKAEVEEEEKKSEKSPLKEPSVSNKFINDGSFMEQFLKLKRKNEEVDEEEDFSSSSSPPRSDVKIPKLEEGDDNDDEAKEGEEYYSCPIQSSCHPSSSLTPNKEYGPSSSEEPHPGKVEEETGGVSSSSSIGKLSAVKLSTVAEELASMVAVSGDQLEEVARKANAEEDELAFLYDVKGDVYKEYRRRVDSLRTGMNEVRKQSAVTLKRKSRWGDENDRVSALAHPGKSQEILQYAMKVYGSINLEPHQWKQCEDQIKMNMVYQDLLIKQEQNLKLAQQGKHKYEYDSDEDTEGGTWEHRLRKLEMDKTFQDASKLTEAAKGRHHIGDFLPAEELSKFMSKYQALKNGEDIDESDYQENKLTEENKGFKLLQKMGWNEGGGLGSSGQGITNPINNTGQGSDKKGLGITKPHELEKSDDEFDAYRKRMMMAYRFRPNPLNNPRRAYY